MKKFISIFLFIVSSFTAFGQTIDDPFSKKEMKKDFEVFKETRLKANSGLYKYRSKEQIDSIYNWAEKEISKSTNYLDFYNIICQLSDFEGSCHNNTGLPKKYAKNLRKENYGYFPYPIKWIEGKWIINFKDGAIPLGSEIIEINGKPIAQVINNLHKYYTTDGQNITGKRIGIRGNFPKYYRFHYGQQKEFQVTFSRNNTDSKEKKTLKSISYLGYYKNFNQRHSKPFDQLYYANLKENQKYSYKKLDISTGILTIHRFSMGNETSEGHKTYVAFLDSIFTKIKTENLKNLIVDVRLNRGGDDPNDVVTYSYLTSRKFQESKQVWIPFQKIPLLKYYDSPFPRFLRPLGVGKHNRYFRNRFPIKKDGKYFISKAENEMKVRVPNKNAFTGNIYLLISPAVASAGSLFGSMVAGNENTTVIGEETMGGYYGHNGHTPFGYALPKSKIVTAFFIDNIEQDVPNKENQFYNRGIIPDYETPQTFEDFLSNKDTQMEFVMQLIEKN